MADLFFDRFTSEVSGPQEIAAQGPVVAPTVAVADATGTAPAGTATPMPQAASPALPARKMTPAPALSVISLIPKQMFGLPIVAIVGILLYIPVFILIFKVYVFG